MVDLNTDWLYQQRSSSNIKIVSSDGAFSYNQLNRFADNYCAYLKSLGVGQGNNVAILSENNPHFLAALFGIWRAKAVPVPLNTKLTIEEIERLTISSDSTCLIVQKDIFPKGKFKNTGINILDFPLTESLSAGSSADYNISPEETALIMYTSGSSGAPKGVELSFASLYSSAINANEILEHTENDKWLASLPFYHIGGFSMIIRSILYGTSIIIPSSMNYLDIIKSIDAHKPSLISLAPTNLKRIIESGVKPNKELRHVLLGGGPSDKDLVEKAIDEGWKIVKVYGSTETSSFVSAVDCSLNKTKSGSSGKALSENRICIYDERFSVLENNIAGEIAVSGPSLFKRYYKEENYTKTKFHGSFYLTGDFGYLDDEGYLYVLSRRTDLIISGGENISPFEIEDKLNGLDNVIESCVFPLDDKEWGQIAAAAIVIKENYNDIEKKLQEELRRILPSFKIPKKIFIIKELPKTSIGKLKRDEIRKRFNGEDVR